MEHVPMPVSNTPSSLWEKREDGHPDRAHHVAKERRQAHRVNEAAWIAAGDILKDAGNPNDLIKALQSGVVDCLFIDPSRWWLKPWTVPQHIWESAQFKNGKLWRNGICLEGPHQKLVINERQWCEHLGRPGLEAAAPVPAEGDALQSQPPHQVEQFDISTKRDVETPAPGDKTKKRATVRAQLGTYTNHVAEHLERTDEYPSEEDDRIWAQNNSYVQKHVTTVLRPQYREGLAKPEQDRFQDTAKGKHRPIKDPGP
jgi:hypothetical protein